MYVALIGNALSVCKCLPLQPRNMPNIAVCNIAVTAKKKSTSCSIDVIFNLLMRTMSRMMKLCSSTLTLRRGKIFATRSPTCYALKQIETTLNTRSRGTVVSLHSSGGSIPSPTTRLCKKLFSWLIILKVMMSISSWKNSTDSTPPTYPRLLTELKF